MPSDTIAALASAPGTGAVCILRVSGPQAVEIVSRVMQATRNLRDFPARVLKRAHILDATGHKIDDVLVARFPAPASFTGEDVVEIFGHGGPLVAHLLLECLVKAGARPAGPGEFSQRAFLNGKLDLAQAEAVMDVISAQTALALRAAQQQLDGGLSQQVHQLREELIGLLAHVEAYIDFPDEDIDPDTGKSLVARIQSAAATINRLLGTAERGRILRHGLRLVIAGTPNAGKSSLLNLLLGFDRAIVSAEAGTTRDTVEETIDLGGIPVRLVDTAGLRPDAGDIERLGMARTEAALATADFVLELVDGNVSPDPRCRVVIPESAPHQLLVLNKSDLGIHPDWAETAAVRVSCTTRQGLDDLVVTIQNTLATSPALLDGSPIAINARHQQCLRIAAAGLAASIALLDATQAPELVAEELRSALIAIGDITGQVDAEEILGAIFGRFCIGK